MHLQRPFITQHRLAKLVAWALAALLWMTATFFSDAPANRRHIRKRYGALTLDAMARMVGHLVIIRAAQITGLKACRRATHLDFAPRGFARRMHRSGLARSGAGAWLRGRLRCACPENRFTVLVAALRDLDALARAWLRRIGGRLTRLSPLILTHPHGEAVRDLAAPVLCVADTS